MNRLIWIGLLLPLLAHGTELARSDAGGVSIVIYDSACKANPAAAAARMIDAPRHTYYDGCYDLDQVSHQILFEWGDGSKTALPASLFHISAPKPPAAPESDVHRIAL